MNGGPNMAKITASVSLLDISPARDLMQICADMAEDDRVPNEYRIKIVKALRPYLSSESEERTVTVQY